MARNLIGTGADQVSVNGMLGELAFQSKENVNFTGGTGKLSKLDIEAISAQLGVTATDIFVYDTSKDSDGGAWRKRCQRLSWYNETLNTSVRGSRKEFPSIAVIVLHTSGVTIYDGDEPTLPMWMVIVSGSSGWNSRLLPITSGTDMTAVSAVNSSVAISTTSNTVGLVVLRFAADNTYCYCTSTFGGIDSLPLSMRNSAGHTFAAGSTSSTLPAIVYNYINDVAMTVLPDAPIASDTGLPFPTIALATSGGVGIIHNTNTAVKITETGGPNSVWKVWFRKDGKLSFYTSGTPGSGGWPQLYCCALPYSNVSAGYFYGMNGLLSGYEMHGGAWDNSSIGSRHLAYNGTSLTALSENASGSTMGLTLYAPNNSNPASDMACFITSKYNSGWMLNDIRGAWLCDVENGIISTQNRLQSKNFTAWSAGSGWTISSGTATHVNGSAGYLTISGVPLVTGKAYTVKVTGTFSTSDSLLLANHGYNDANVVIPVQVSTDTFYVTWTQGSSNTNSVVLWTGNSCTITAIELYEADADRSTQNRGLQLFGSLNKVKVAADTDTVGYTGFSGSNYLQQTYNTALDFGTGSFSINLWVKHYTTSVANNIIFERSMNNATQYGRIGVYRNGTSNKMVFYTSDVSTGALSQIESSRIVTPDAWTMITCVRSGGVGYIYENGVLMGSTAMTGNVTMSGATLVVGTGYSLANNYTDNVIAMLRISGTVPSAEQVAQIYADERALFQDGAKSTLFGTSDSISALGYDQDMKLLHVGTSAGRSAFQGLRRIDNTTTAVTTSISAANGLVAEQ